MLDFSLLQTTSDRPPTGKRCHLNSSVIDNTTRLNILLLCPIIFQIYIKHSKEFTKSDVFCVEFIIFRAMFRRRNISERIVQEKTCSSFMIYVYIRIRPHTFFFRPVLISYLAHVWFERLLVLSFRRMNIVVFTVQKSWKILRH